MRNAERRSHSCVGRVNRERERRKLSTGGGEIEELEVGAVSARERVEERVNEKELRRRTFKRQIPRPVHFCRFCRVPSGRLSTQMNGACEYERVLTCTLVRHECLEPHQKTSALVLQMPERRVRETVHET